MLLTFLFIQILNFTTDNYLGRINAKLLSDKVIIISENGVARRQEVLNKIYCKDVEWHIEWKADIKGTISKAKITYVSNKESIILRDNAIELISKAEHLDGISASCNPSDGIRSTKSNLLIMATDKETGEYILGKLVMEPNTRKAKWYFSHRD